MSMIMIKKRVYICVYGEVIEFGVEELGKIIGVLYGGLVFYFKGVI